MYNSARTGRSGAFFDNGKLRAGQRDAGVFVHPEDVDTGLCAVGEGECRRFT